MSHLSYDAVIAASESSEAHPHGYRYVVVELRGASRARKQADSMDNPASTKRKVYGPGVWLWEIHPSGVTIREYDSIQEIHPELRDTAAHFVGAERAA